MARREATNACVGGGNDLRLPHAWPQALQTSPARVTGSGWFFWFGSAIGYECL